MLARWVSYKSHFAYPSIIEVCIFSSISDQSISGYNSLYSGKIVSWISAIYCFTSDSLSDIFSVKSGSSLSNFFISSVLYQELMNFFKSSGEIFNSWKFLLTISLATADVFHCSRT